LYCLSCFPPRVRYFYYFSQSCIIAHHAAHFVVYPCFLTIVCSVCIFCIILLCSFLPLHFFFSLPVLRISTHSPHHTASQQYSYLNRTTFAAALFTRSRSIRFRSLFLLLFVLLSDDIELNPGPSAFTLCTLNIRSILHPLHSAALSHLIDTHNPDLFCLTETWIKPTNTAAELLNCTPPHYSLISTPRNGSNKISSSGGGTAFLIRELFT